MKIEIKDYPNAQAFVMTTMVNGNKKNVATVNYDFGVDKELMRLHAENLKGTMEAFDEMYGKNMECEENY